MSAPRSQIVRDSAALAALVPDWTALFRASPSATPFQSPVWLTSWWDVFAPGQLATLALWRSERLIALAPLYLESGPLGLRLLPLGIGVSDYWDLLLDPNEEDALEVMARELSTLAPWEICELAELAPGALALRLPCPDDASESLSQASLCPFVPLPDRTGDLGTFLPATKLRKLRMARRRAAKRGEIAILVGDVDNAEAMLQDLVRLHRACWERRGQPGVLTGRVVQFHAAALPGLLQAGLVRLYALVIGGQMAAVYYGFLDRGRAYAYLGGFDPDLAFESPGALVLVHAIAQAVAEGAESFDFLRGAEDYKYAWGAQDRANARRLFTRNLRNGG